MLGDGRGGLDWLHAIVVMLIEGVESLVLECILFWSQERLRVGLDFMKLVLGTHGRRVAVVV